MKRLPLDQRIERIRSMIDAFEQKASISDTFRVAERSLLCRKTRSLVPITLSVHEWKIIDRFSNSSPSTMDYYIDLFRECAGDTAATKSAMMHYVDESLEILYYHLHRLEAENA
ncbi:MAG: hypothetical protein V2I43_23405 [Parvularcula sp.]|jgi:hypothetical protein|nr:hypothetical protein [Parvularcula sp.]